MSSSTGGSCEPGLYIYRRSRTDPNPLIPGFRSHCTALEYLALISWVFKFYVRQDAKYRIDHGLEFRSVPLSFFSGSSTPSDATWLTSRNLLESTLSGSQIYRVVRFSPAHVYPMNIKYFTTAFVNCLIPCGRTGLKSPRTGQRKGVRKHEHEDFSRTQNSAEQSIGFKCTIGRTPLYTIAPAPTRNPSTLTKAVSGWRQGQDSRSCCRSESPSRIY